MSREGSLDCLMLFCTDPNSKLKYLVGYLVKETTSQTGTIYKFKYAYSSEFNNSLQHINKIESFRYTDKTYISKKLFPVFASRLPDRNRKDIKKILKKYNLKEYDEFELLKRSGSRLPIDTYEFIPFEKPISNIESFKDFEI